MPRTGTRGVGLAALACASLLACGRIGFGDLGDGGGGGGGGGGGSHDAANKLDADVAMPALVGSDSNTTGAGSNVLPVFQPFGSNVLVVVAIAIQGTPAVMSIGDSVGNHYMEHDATASSPGGSVALWYTFATMPSDGSAITITFAGSVQAEAWTWVFDNISSTSPLDNTAATNNTMMASPASAPSFTTSLPNEVLVAVVHDDGGDVNGLEGAVFSPYTSLADPQSGDSSAFLITTSPTTYPGAEFMMSVPETICAVTAAFRPAM